MNFTTEQAILIICGLIGAAITFITLIEKITSIITLAKGPISELDKRVAALEHKADHYDHYLNNDKRRIEYLERTMAVTIRAQFALVRHAINGNDIDQCRAVEKELQEFLSNQGQERGWTPYGEKTE
ncbi:hypothetical protein [Butyrivibrio sp. FC2001]|uniref:hypothetical protein n=1 Tax=Butyrivibrio sp. FC2001 TaxID=1280671 RepID=UPI00047BDD38|nr:hypothetical protein [Butyrivibrio sp. FC2001]